MDPIFQAGVVAAPLQVLIDRLASLAVQEIGPILATDGEFRKLQRTLERIRAMVGHVEENRSIFTNSISSEAWKLWLEDLEELSYSADNFLDGILLDLSKHRANLPADSNGDNQVRNMLLSSFKVTVPREITRIRQELEGIAKEMDVLYMTELTRLSSNKKILKFRPTYGSYSSARSSLVDEGSVVGRERDRNNIVEMLMAENLTGSNVSVIPIVGMGGIGKTTLAQMVYNDDRLVGKFDQRMWVSVSVDFDTIGITKSIIESASGERCELSYLDPVQIELCDLIRNKKFLLVLDDYWSEEYGDWDVLSSPLKFGLRGSTIVLTTRSMKVSQILGTVPSYCLDGLTDGDCWELIKRRALSNRVFECNSQFEQVGRMIAKKCKGLPLAAKSLGGLLHFKDNLAEWNSVLKSEIWDLPHDKNDIFPALALSYHQLPTHLKSCFAYCSTFPKNYHFEMNELGLLWIAEGFVRPRGNVRLEDIGNDYFKDLLWRSFFQLSHEDANSRNIYKMHDLIHSMAQLVSAHTCYHQEGNQLNEEYPLLRNTRHFSLYYDSMQPTSLEGSMWYKNLRTFRVTCANGKMCVSYDLFLKLKFSRVLDLSRIGLDDLPDSIGHLKHLRYLDLSENHFKKLPESITNLFGLQTLKLEQCKRLIELPSDMKNMVNLRHLEFDLKQLNRMPPKFGRLVNLQALSAFIVGRTEGCNIRELKNMRFLRGSICIKNLENVSNVTEAREAMLDMKPFINRLELEWSDSRYRFNDEEILAGLRPHENLEELILTNYFGFLLPAWFSVCKISRIHLQNCQHPHILAPLGKLRHLKSLVIESMSNWNHIDLQEPGFPVLEYLKIDDMPNLTEFSNNGDFPSLRTLDISDCQMLTNLPSFLHTTRLQYLKISRCPEIVAFPACLPTSLESLSITESDILVGRCRSQEGEDWHKIRAIPKIEMDNMEIQWS